VSAWNPSASSDVLAIAPSGSSIYLGGAFALVGGQGCGYLASVDAASGALSAWRPWPDDVVWALAATGSAIYAGGAFGQVGAALRDHIAAFDPATGAATVWNPLLDGTAYALAPVGSGIYVAGAFWHAGSSVRNDAALFDCGTGNECAFDPNVTGDIARAIVADAGIVYLGGTFTSVQGAPRLDLAATVGASGAPLAWDPAPDSAVFALATGPGRVYVGGHFRHIGGRARSGLAAFTLPPELDAPAPEPPGRLSLSPIAPDPARASAAVRFTLPRPARVLVRAFDLQGRRVGGGIERPLPAGAHELRLDVSGLAPGVYVCRLDAGGASATRRFVVVR